MILIIQFFYIASAHGHDAKKVLNITEIPVKGSPSSGDIAVIGVDELAGKKIAQDALFYDENGKVFQPSAFIDRPVIILPVFYHCTQACGMMLGSLASALNDVPLIPGEDYRVLSISIDYEDDSISAMRSKENYLKIYKKEFPPADWLFLTGDLKNIIKFTDSIGFKFKRVSKHNFTHPNVMIIVSHDGTIIRYMYGPTFLPFDIGMALTEASMGTPSISVRKLLSYCLTYDPARKTYTLTIIRFFVIGILGLIGLILFVILRKKNTD